MRVEVLPMLDGQMTRFPRSWLQWSSCYPCRRCVGVHKLEAVPMNGVLDSKIFEATTPNYWVYKNAVLHCCNIPLCTTSLPPEKSVISIAASSQDWFWRWYWDFSMHRLLVALRTHNIGIGICLKCNVYIKTNFIVIGMFKWLCHHTTGLF